MRYFLALLLLLGCNNHPTAPDRGPETLAQNFFEVETNTLSPDNIHEFSFGGKEFLTYFISQRYVHNTTDRTYVPKMRRYVQMYQLYGDSLVVRKIGPVGWLEDARGGHLIESIRPGQMVRYKARADSIEYDPERNLYYINGWVEKERDFPPELLKIAPIEHRRVW